MTERSRFQRFFSEARRRKVYTSAVAYVALSLVLLQVGEAIFNAFGYPPIAIKILTILLLLGFPIVLILAWIFDFGPGGLQRTESIGDKNARLAVTAAPQGWGGSFPHHKAEIARPAPIELTEEAPDPERLRRATLAFVRHELRTPINAIIGYSEMLADDARDEKQIVALNDLERIQKGGREILSLVDGILGAEHIDADPERDLESYGEQIRADLRDPLGAVVGYTEMLIETSAEDHHEARIPDLEKILSAARKLLDMSNDIAALATHSPTSPGEMAKGASLAEGVLSKIRAVQTSQVEPDRNASLLVVDDSPMNRDLLAKQLARKGYFVTTAETGRGALSQMAEQQFDLVLLDMLMPDMDGVEVLRRMKNDGDLCEVPVIMISALDEIDSVVRCLEIGAADFVSKPFHPTLLDARINATLAAHSRAAARSEDSDATTRLVNGTFPAYVVERVRAGETRLLDSAPNAVTFFVDIEQAVAAADPRERAGRVEMLIQLAHEIADQNEVNILMHGIGLCMAAGFPASTPDAAPARRRGVRAARPGRADRLR